MNGFLFALLSIQENSLFLGNLGKTLITVIYNLVETIVDFIYLFEIKIPLFLC